MATLYVRNVPVELYEALRARARSRRRSIAAEVIELLKQNIPTRRELKAREMVFQKFAGMRATKSRTSQSFEPTEEMQRRDRAR